MAEIVLAYAASHAPMMSSARETAPEEQRNNFFAAMDRIRALAQERDVQAAVVLSNEHFTNFFLENFPQICVGSVSGTGGRPRPGCRSTRPGSPGTRRWPTTSSGTP
jgi:hypothetical protein